MLSETYPNVSGLDVPILQLAVDSGYALAILFPLSTPAY